MNFLPIAQALRADSIAAIPTRADKVAAIKWRAYESQLPTEAELVEWFDKNQPDAIALIGGAVQCLDFDEKYARGIFGRFVTRAREVGLGDVVDELLRQRTPSGGYHLVFKGDGPELRNVKLASRHRGTDRESLIETRGAGGYFLISPSPGYVLEAGDFSSIPTITPEDRDALLELARTFDETPPVEAHSTTTAAPPRPDEGTPPGDDYDLNADVPALLKAHGWRPAGPSGKYWTRPGKTRGVSATWNVVPNRFYVFTTSTALSAGHIYRPWSLYAIFECGGDFSRAAAELRRQGFGGRRSKPAAKTLSQYIADAEAHEPPPEFVDDPDFPIERTDPDDLEPEKDHEEPDPEPEGIAPGAAPTNENEDDRIRRLLRAREFDPTRTPPIVRPIFEVSLGPEEWAVISTPGNLTAIIAPPKVGKTSFSSAMVAATITGEAEADTLGVRGLNTDGKAVLFVDTEQAPDDFWHGIDRARRRARLPLTVDIPAWLKAYTVADLSAPVSRRAIGLKMADLAAEFGGIHSVFLDGAADLVLDVNDAKECNELVAELHGLAIRYECAIVCILHLNPGTEKARGHLGSQIERKAETNLKIEKDESISIVWSNKQRRAPIDKDRGPRFAWSTEAKMHVSVKADGTGLTRRQQSRVSELIDLATAVLKPGESLRWSDLIVAMQEARRTPNKTPSEDTARRWVNAMKDQKIITCTFGFYALNPLVLNPQPANSPANAGTDEMRVNA